MTIRLTAIDRNRSEKRLSKPSRCGVGEMAMRILRAVISSAVLLAMVLSAFVMFSSSVLAREYVGTSPSFAVDTWWSLYVDHCDPGDIIWWYWESDDSLGFRLLNTPDMIPIYGFSSWDGYVVQDPGWYNLGWYNNNLFFSATVYYSVEVFRPSAATVVEPLDGSYVNTRIIDLHGTFDTRAEGVLVGPDALHLRKAAAVGDSWGLDNLALNEGQNTILVRSYYWLDGYGYGNYTIDKTIHVTADTLPPELAAVTPASNAYLNGAVDLSWQCADECGIALMEVRIDISAWQPVASTVFHTDLTDGSHELQVRVTDLAGNSATASTRVISDTVAPTVSVSEPKTDSKISLDAVAVSWTGSDALAGLDHYEIKVDGGTWTSVGTATTYQLNGLADMWHSVTVKAVDKSGNTATSTVGFGIYTSIWSQNGPYNGIPLYALIAGIVAIVALSLFLWYRKGKSSPQEPASGDAPKVV